jgi:hypothetical protein
MWIFDVEIEKLGAVLKKKHVEKKNAWLSLASTNKAF